MARQVGARARHRARVVEEAGRQQQPRRPARRHQRPREGARPPSRGRRADRGEREIVRSAREVPRGARAGEKEKVRHVVFWVWDRTTRNFTDYELLEDLIRRDELVLHVAHERWQLHAGSDEGDWLKAEMNTLVAKTYSRQLSRRAKESQDAKARDGWYPTRPPIGYRNAKLVGVNGVVRDRGGTIELLAAGRTMLRRMFSMRIAGHSLEAIGEAVVAEGLWSALGSKNRRVVAGDVERILKDEFYAGWFTWRDERYRGKHDPIFTADEWAALRATFTRGNYGSPLENAGALSGFLACAQCGCRITYDPKIKTSGKRYDYYRCANGHRVHTKRIHVTEAELLAQFEAAVANIEMPTALADEISRVLRETHDVVREERRREIATLKRTIDELQAREDRVVALYVDGKLDDVTYQRHRNTLLTDKHAALDRLGSPARTSTTSTSSPPIAFSNSRRPRDRCGTSARRRRSANCSRWCFRTQCSTA